jgi:hypothetical protein
LAKNLLRDMGKRIAHSLRTGDFGKQEKRKDPMGALSAQPKKYRRWRPDRLY